jgi:hypothetical protein
MHNTPIRQHLPIPFRPGSLGLPVQHPALGEGERRGSWCANSRYSRNLLRKVRILIPSALAAWVRLPFTRSRVCIIKSRSISHKEPAVDGVIVLVVWDGAGGEPAAADSSMRTCSGAMPSPPASSTARSTAFSSSRTLPFHRRPCNTASAASDIRGAASPFRDAVARTK